MHSKTCALILGSSTTLYNYSGTQKRKHFSFLNSGVSLAAELISNFYTKKNIPTYLATDMPAIPKLEAFKKLNILEVESLSSVTETLAASLRELNGFDEIIINPIQSIPAKQTSVCNIVLSDKEYLKEDWTSVDFNSNKTPHFLFKAQSFSYGKKSYAFSGRLHCYLKDLLELVYLTLPGELDDLGHLAYKLFAHKSYSFFFDKWLDLSHTDLKLESKMNIISSRSFHSLTYESKSKVIRKKMNSTSSVSRLESYYNTLTKEAALYFPCLVSADEGTDMMSCSFEFIPHPTLSELFLHEDLGIISWVNIAKQLKDVNDCISSIPIAQPTLQDNYFSSEKLRIRRAHLEKLISGEEMKIISSIYESAFSVCGIHYPPLKKTFEDVDTHLRQLEDEGLEYAFSHGDLCFNNILADPLSGIVKVIDPRISSETTLPLGVLPRLYDLAKLKHSATYMYDSIVNNLFDLSCNSTQSFHLKVFVPGKYDMINTVFKDVFSKAINSHSVNILTASLFLSMLPLHAESPRRMLSLAVIGSSIINHPNQSTLHFSLR
ncbi:hypothetical protein ACLM45_08195 [Synechococcus sp. A10-1-5-9]|uniref:hypothetical protein n=1 Tax=Synechococcus sp. A10-1-5-9 TaxID=3392295 RepID=UPI0039ED2A1E